MDYGKYSYIKLSEQDSSLSKLYVDSNSAIEFSQPALHTTVNDSYVLPVGTVKMLGKMYIQNNITFSSDSEGTVDIELLLNGIVIEKITRQLSTGECSVLMMKTYNSSTLSSVNLSIRVKSLTEEFSTIIISNFMAVWGAVKDAQPNNISTIRKLEDGENIIISFVEDEKIYYAIVSKAEQSISRSQFSYLTSGISHCFAKDKHGNVFLFRVDLNKNLYYCKMSNMLSETLIASNVDSVYASICPEDVTEEMLICYIQNNKPKYRTYSNLTLGSECSFDAPKQYYVDIYIADSINASRMYVVASTSSGNNYIFVSQEDGLLSGFSESVNISCELQICRYTSLKNLINSLSENISIGALFSLQKHYLAYADLFSSGLNENINADVDMLLTTYEKSQIQDYFYTIEFDQSKKFTTSLEQDGVTHKPRIVYGEDAASWSGVVPTFDENTHLATFVDKSGLNQRWPFCEIKPCLVQNGELVGYLKPNDYSKFEDGTAADIYSGDYDVMIQFPKIYYKIEEDWDGQISIVGSSKAKVKISISSTPREGFVCHSHTRAGQEYDYIYVGAYESHISNGKLYCCSGKLPTSDINHIQIIQNWQTLKGGSYTTLNYHFTTYLQILSFLYFQEYYGCQFLGYGWTSATSSNIETSGQLDLQGMFYASNDGTYSAAEVLHHNKLFGLENIWGHSKTYVDGLLETENKEFLVIDNTQANSEINLQGTGYTAFAGLLPTTNWTTSTWLGLFRSNNAYGFLPVNGGTSLTYMSYNQYRVANYKPSGYRYFAPNTTCPHMLFTYGGDGKKHCGFSIFADRDFKTNASEIYHNERIICYPLSKKSK